LWGQVVAISGLKETTGLPWVLDWQRFVLAERSLRAYVVCESDLTTEFRVAWVVMGHHLFF
jgi:hypothetical protein